MQKYITHKSHQKTMRGIVFERHDIAPIVRNVINIIVKHILNKGNIEDIQKIMEFTEELLVILSNKNIEK